MRTPLIRLSFLLSLLIASSASAVTSVIRGRSRARWFAIIAALNFLPIRSAVGITYSFVDLTPSGFERATAAGISGGQEVGYGYGYGSASGYYNHPLLWSGSAASAVDLNPAGFTNSYAYGVSGGQQFGLGTGTATGNVNHALLWSGSAGSAVDLNPPGFTLSDGSGISGGQEVGYGYGPATSNAFHGLLWSGSAASAVDLSPVGFDRGSFAVGISGGKEVGYGFSGATGNNEHALLWSGTAASAVDLNPAGFDNSFALGVFGGKEVGSGSGAATGNNSATVYDHALLWSGTAASAVDLNPAGFTYSYALGVFGGQQVGDGHGPATGNHIHALLWSGTAASVVDLQSFLSSAYTDSYAYAIDANGNIIGRATFAADGRDHAIEWVVVPEPGTGLLVIAGLLGLAGWRRVRP